MIDNSEQLKKIRKEKGLTIQAVCDGAGIPIRTYQNYEYGKREISAEALYKLSDFYGVTTDYLLGREPAPNPFADLGLDETNEQEMLAQYMSFPPEIRATLMDVLIKLADSARPEQEPDEPEEPTPRPSQMVAVCSADLSANSDADEGERKETA